MVSDETEKSSSPGCWTLISSERPFSERYLITSFEVWRMYRTFIDAAFAKSFLGVDLCSPATRLGKRSKFHLIQWILPREIWTFLASLASYYDLLHPPPPFRSVAHALYAARYAVRTSINFVFSKRYRFVVCVTSTS